MALTQIEKERQQLLKEVVEYTKQRYARKAVNYEGALLDMLDIHRHRIWFKKRKYQPKKEAAQREYKEKMGIWLCRVFGTFGFKTTDEVTEALYLDEENVKKFSDDIEKTYNEMKDWIEKRGEELSKEDKTDESEDGGIENN